MRKLVALVSITFVLAPGLVGSTARVGAQAPDCQMIGWTGLRFLPPQELAWRGDVENLDATVVRALDDIPAFGWSPDGERFAFVDSSDPAQPALHVAEDSVGGGGFDIAGVSGSSVVWSPSGDRVLVSNTSNAEVAVVDESGIVVTLDAAGRNAAWSSDGVWVAWTSDAGIEVAHPDGSGAALLAAAPSNGVLWRPGTHQLLVLAPSFLIAEADSSSLVPFTVSPIDYARDFAWSPDGARLAWSASVDGSQPPRIWVDELDGAGSHPASPLLPSPGNAAMAEPFTTPFWSPDGSQIAAGEFEGPWSTGFTGGAVRVRLVPADGSDEGRPITAFAEVGAPVSLSELLSVAWSPDHRSVAVEIRQSGLIGSSSVTFVSYSVADVSGTSERPLGSSFRIRGHVEWWPVVGTVDGGGRCVLADATIGSDEVPSSVPMEATQPQFTG